MSENLENNQSGLKLAAPRSLYFAIFAISGFSGLIYESIWSHYLKLFLGHAAYAQSLVLIIFMGGMAGGSWLASRFSARMRIPILAYAAVEAVVGVIALVFHDLFVGLIDVFHTSILPGLGTPILGITLKWLAAGLLILPQSLLLGMTFPLMSAGIIRRFPETPGGSIAMLYFTNSIGAAIGVLVSGFLMIRAFGLPGTIMSAGLLNIALALTVWTLVKLDPEPATKPLTGTINQDSASTLGPLFLVAAFITGMASFIYEISWIRMLSLVLGATTHSFELMLSAFITGLAFGGLWIKSRIDRLEDPVRFSGYVQLVMGVLALLTIPVYVLTFDWMAWLRGGLQTTDAAFTMYTMASHVVAMAVMLPTTFIAGMTLPLFTYVLLRKGGGEASIGRIYAANTTGAIVGVLFAVHIGLPALGLKNLIVFGACLDIVLGLVLLRRFAKVDWNNLRFATSVAMVVAVSGYVVVGTPLDERLLTSGVYRYKRTDVAMNDDLLFYRDGKTASVSFRRSPEGQGTLSTNGKPDASIQLERTKPPSPDEATMVLAGAIPMAYAPDAARVANIGLGSGQTAHTVLGNPGIERIDTVEIEVEMVNASRYYKDLVWRAHEDPRSHIHIEDAKTYFSLNNITYDIIIAEPSNPWVSGVSSLFSKEFYSTIRDYLEDDGIFVQWIQAYEFTDELAVSVLKAVSGNFEDYSLYFSNSMDVILIAKKHGKLGEPDWDAILQGEVGESLARQGIRSASDLLVRQSANRAMLAPYLEDAPTPTNSDYYPFVDLNAGKAMFAASDAGMFLDWMLASVPVLEMLSHPRIRIRYQDVSPQQLTVRARTVDAAAWIFDKMTTTGISDPLDSKVGVPPELSYAADWLVASQQTCVATANPVRWSQLVLGIMSATLPNLDPDRAVLFVDQIVESACELADEPAIQKQLELYRAVAMRDGDSMFEIGRVLLGESLDFDRPYKSYLINAAMLGAVSVGRRREAFDIWTQYGMNHYDANSIPPFMKLVLSLSARFEDAAPESPIS